MPVNFNSYNFHSIPINSIPIPVRTGSCAGRHLCIGKLYGVQQFCAEICTQCIGAALCYTGFNDRYKFFHWDSFYDFSEAVRAGFGSVVHNAVKIVVHQLVKTADMIKAIQFKDELHGLRLFEFGKSVDTTINQIRVTGSHHLPVARNDIVNEFRFSVNGTNIGFIGHRDDTALI